MTLAKWWNIGSKDRAMEKLKIMVCVRRLLKVVFFSFFFYIYFCFIDYVKAFDCVDHNKLENSSSHGITRPSYLPPEKSVCRSKSNMAWIWNMRQQGHGTMRTWNNRLAPNWKMSMSRMYITTLLI